MVPGGSGADSGVDDVGEHDVRHASLARACRAEANDELEPGVHHLLRTCLHEVVVGLDRAHHHARDPIREVSASGRRDHLVARTVDDDPSVPECRRDASRRRDRAGCLPGVGCRQGLPIAAAGGPPTGRRRDWPSDGENRSTKTCGSRPQLPSTTSNRSPCWIPSVEPQGHPGPKNCVQAIETPPASAKKTSGTSTATASQLNDADVVDDHHRSLSRPDRVATRSAPTHPPQQVRLAMPDQPHQGVSEIDAE
jgi:hypothetical protein